MLSVLVLRVSELRSVCAGTGCVGIACVSTECAATACHY